MDTLPNWPVGAGAKGNQELAELVGATPNAIGYVESSQAARLNLAVAQVSNRAGRFVSPNLASLQAASATASWDPGRHFCLGLAEAEPGGEDAYPIVATVYALVSRRAAPARARSTVEFFRLGLTERAGDAVALGYVPLPEPVVRQVEEYWRATIHDYPTMLEGATCGYDASADTSAVDFESVAFTLSRGPQDQSRR